MNIGIFRGADKFLDFMGNYRSATANHVKAMKLLASQVNASLLDNAAGWVFLCRTPVAALSSAALLVAKDKMASIWGQRGSNGQFFEVPFILFLII